MLLEDFVLDYQSFDKSPYTISLVKSRRTDYDYKKLYINIDLPDYEIDLEGTKVSYKNSVLELYLYINTSSFEVVEIDYRLKIKEKYPHLYVYRNGTFCVGSSENKVIFHKLLQSKYLLAAADFAYNVLQTPGGTGYNSPASILVHFGARCDSCLGEPRYNCGVTGKNLCGSCIRSIDGSYIHPNLVHLCKVCHNYYRDIEIDRQNVCLRCKRAQDAEF